MNEKLRKLQERKLTLVNKMREVNDAATFDEAAYQRMSDDMASIEKEIERETRLSQYEDAMNEVRDEPIISNPSTNAERANVEKEKRYQDAFETMLRMPMNALSQEVRTVLNTGTGSEGGYVVPQTYLTTVINKLLNMSVVRGISNVIRTSSTTNIPLGANRPSFALIAENGTYGTTNPTFAQKVLNAYKLGGIIKTSEIDFLSAFIKFNSFNLRCRRTKHLTRSQMNLKNPLK